MVTPHRGITAARAMHGNRSHRSESHGSARRRSGARPLSNLIQPTDFVRIASIKRIGPFEFIEAIFIIMTTAAGVTAAGVTSAGVTAAEVMAGRVTAGRVRADRGALDFHRGRIWNSLITAYFRFWCYE